MDLISCLRFKWGDWDSESYYPRIRIFAEDINRKAMKDIEEVVVPGRNGTLHIDNGRYGNVEEKYRVFFDAANPGELRELIQMFRNAFDGVNVRYSHSFDEYHYMEGMVKSFELTGVNTPKSAEYELVIERRAERFFALNNTYSFNRTSVISSFDLRIDAVRPDGAIGKCSPIVKAHANAWTTVRFVVYKKVDDDNSEINLSILEGYKNIGTIAPHSFGNMDIMLDYENSTIDINSNHDQEHVISYSSSKAVDMYLKPFDDGDYMTFKVDKSSNENPVRNTTISINVDWRWWEL